MRVSSLQRRTIARIIVLVVISGFFLGWVGVQNYVVYALNVYALNPNGRAIDAALGQLARAESAQTPYEVIDYLTVAKAHLPKEGSVSWWSPEKANFESIQAELDDIIIRAKNISSLELGNELYNSEMYAIHARLKVIQETLVAF